MFYRIEKFTFYRILHNVNILYHHASALFKASFRQKEINHAENRAIIRKGFRSGQVRSGMGARAATALRRAHLSAPLPRPIPGDRPGLRWAH